MSGCVGTVLKIAKWIAQENISWVARHQSWVNIKLSMPENWCYGKCFVLLKKV